MLWGQLNKVLEGYNNIYFTKSGEMCPKLLTEMDNFKIKMSSCVSVGNGSGKSGSYLGGGRFGQLGWGGR